MRKRVRCVSQNSFGEEILFEPAASDTVHTESAAGTGDWQGARQTASTDTTPGPGSPDASKASRAQRPPACRCAHGLRDAAQSHSRSGSGAPLLVQAKRHVVAHGAESAAVRVEGHAPHLVRVHVAEGLHALARVDVPHLGNVSVRSYGTGSGRVRARARLGLKGW